MTRLATIQTMHLFAPLESKLIDLLNSLTADEWSVRALPKWTVKDIAAHLLDTSLRRLSMVRDGYLGESFSGSAYQELVDFLNGLNADWVKAFRRVSPAILVTMVEDSSREMIRHLESLDPYAPAAFPVAWAGEANSENWFDIAREYTERWHHQQQVREAVNRDGIMSPELYAPVLETFVRVLPHTYRDVKATKGTVIRVEITGQCGGAWYLTRGEEWRLSKDAAGMPETVVRFADTVAWKIFTRALQPEELRAHVDIQGSVPLGEPIASAVAVMM